MEPYEKNKLMIKNAITNMEQTVTNNHLTQA